MNGAFRKTRIILGSSTLAIFCFSLASAAWTSHGPYYKSIRAIALSSQHTNNVFAGAFGWGMFRSTSAGSSWTNYQTGLISTYLRSVIALSDSTLIAGTNDGVYESSDGGITWAPLLHTAHSVRALALDSHTSALYAGTFGSGLYKSTNMGVTWSAISVTDPTGTDPPRTLSHIESIGVFGRDSLYVGGSILDIPTNQGGSLYVTTDGGSTWFQVQYPSPAIRSSVHAIAVSPTNPATSLIIGTATKGVYASTDAGTTWTNLDQVVSPGTSLPDPHVNTVMFTTTHYFAGTDSTGGLYSYSLANPAAGWIAGTGLPGNPVSVNCVMVDPSNPATMYVGLEGTGVYKSTNTGSSWAASNAAMLGTAGRSLSFNGDGTLFLGTDFGDGMWTSPDSARTWARVDSLSTTDPITSFGITNNPLIIYAGAYGTGVHKSTDGGHIWRITDSTTINHFVRPLAVDPANSGIVYAGTGNGVYKTTSGGTSWFSVNSGIPANTSVRALKMDPTNSSILYIGTDSSYLFKSTDGGTSWAHMTNANGFLLQDINIRSLTVDRALPAIVYAGADSGRIYRSGNAGAAWSLLVKLPTTFSVRHILVDPNIRTTLFAATFGSGVFVSVDSGGHWTPFDDSLADQTIYSLESDRNAPLTLIAGSKFQGVYRTSYSAPVNHPPVLAHINNQTISPGQLLVITVSATDPDSTIPALSATGLPAGATFTDSLNGRGAFRWRPADNQSGSYGVTFIASDGFLADSQLVTITVVLKPPVLAFIGNKSVLTGHQLSFAVSASDPDSTIPSLSVRGLPAGASFSDSLNGHGLFSWTPTAAQVGSYGLMFFATHSGLSDSQSVTISVLDSSSAVVADFPVTAGWNMISVPVGVADYRTTTLFPSASSSAFAFSSSYVVSDTLKTGGGYWLKFSQDQTLSVGGSNITTDTIAVRSSWNMIGSLSAPVPVTHVQAVPPVILSARVFAYSSARGYFQADTIHPGQAYWIRTNQAGNVVLAEAGPGLASARAVQATEALSSPDLRLNMFAFLDEQGRERDLFISTGAESQRESSYDLPPPPPGDLDVRFVTQSSLAVADPAQPAQEFPITISSPGGEVRLVPHIIDPSIEFALDVRFEDGTVRRFVLTSAPAAVIVPPGVARAAIRVTERSTSEVPQAFRLEQNYPNPFNPGTVIRYDLPSRNFVELGIFDMLGREVARLVDGIEDRGVHTVSWNAGSCATGVYFYRISVVDPATGSVRFRNVKAMHLLK